MRSKNINNAKESSVAFLHSASFLKRSLTALVLAPLSIWILVLGYPYSAALFLLLLVGMLLEWFWLIGKTQVPHKILWRLGGALYITAGVGGFYHYYDHSSLKAIVLLFVIWATDIGAYFCGKLMGGPKLAPRISPQKTWAGSIGGTLAAALVGIISAGFLQEFRSVSLIFAFIALSIVGQAGDLIESFVKRLLNVKDSGTFLPGHGGLLDRFDSTLAIGVILWCLILQ